MDMVSIPTIMSTTSSCRPHHHLNHIIMSTTHHQAVGKCNSSQACEFTGEKTLGRETCLFWVVWLLGSPKYFRGFAARSGKVADKKCTGLWQELDLHFKISIKLRRRSTSGRWGQKNAHWNSERSIAYNTGKKTGMFGVTRNRLHCQRCAYVGRFSVTFLLRGFATGCEKTHWQGCGQQSMSDAAALLATGIAAATAGGC